MQENKVIAVDLGGTNLRVAYLEKGKIVMYFSLKTPKTKNKIINELIKIIEDILSVYPDVKKIGIGCPGPLLNGIILNPPNLPFRNFNIKKVVQKKFKKIKVVVENDANCVALAESKLGCKKSNFIVLTIGTGIGGGIIINNQIYNGAGMAGELGHMILDNNNDFESLCAWKGVSQITKKEFKKEVLISELFKINNFKSRRTLERITKYLGQGIGSLINIFDPEVVILAGGVSENGTKLLNMIKKQTYKYVVFPKKTEINWSKLEKPGIIGASLL